MLILINDEARGTKQGSSALSTHRLPESKLHTKKTGVSATAKLGASIIRQERKWERCPEMLP